MRIIADDLFRQLVIQLLFLDLLFCTLLISIGACDFMLTYSLTSAATQKGNLHHKSTVLGYRHLR